MASSASATEATAKNVIILIPDGMSQSIQTLGRWYRGESLALDEMGAGTMAAWMVNSITTDSAPAGTAMATGYRTTDKFISVGPIEATALSTYRLPEGIDWDWYSYRPLATVVEGAKHLGKATGLISTSRITHATPASFGAHVEARSMENDIAEQLVHQNLDVVFGGGWDRLLPAPEGSRTDGENLLQVLQDRGYQWVETKSQMDSLTSGRTWGLFAKSAMMPDIDRQYLCNEAFDMQACSEPTLAEMTTKAIELLSQNDNGFVLMVEGSQIDWAGHANDPAYMLHDFLAFDDAVRVALDFAKANPHDTLILAAPDHNTGGLALGNATVHWTYTDITVEDLLDPIKGMQTTAQLMARDLPPQPTPGDIQAVVQQYWGIELSVKDAEDIIAYETDPDVFGFGYAISKIVSERHTILSWASHGHTGEDLPFWSYGKGAPVGHIDITDFGRSAAEALGLNMDLTDPKGMNRHLFVDLETELRRRATHTDLTDPNNPVLKIGKYYELHANKDYLQVTWRNGTQLTCPLGGVAVYAPKRPAGSQWFAPKMIKQVLADPWAYCSR